MFGDRSSPHHGGASASASGGAGRRGVEQARPATESNRRRKISFLKYGSAAESARSASSINRAREHSRQLAMRWTSQSDQGDVMISPSSAQSTTPFAFADFDHAFGTGTVKQAFSPARSSAQLLREQDKLRQGKNKQEPRSPPFISHEAAVVHVDMAAAAPAIDTDNFKFITAAFAEQQHQQGPPPLSLSPPPHTLARQQQQQQQQHSRSSNNALSSHSDSSVSRRRSLRSQSETLGTSSAPPVASVNHSFSVDWSDHPSNLELSSTSGSRVGGQTMNTMPKNSSLQASFANKSPRPSTNSHYPHRTSTPEAPPHVPKHGSPLPHLNNSIGLTNSPSFGSASGSTSGGGGGAAARRRMRQQMRSKHGNPSPTNPDHDPRRSDSELGVSLSAQTPPQSPHHLKRHQSADSMGSVNSARNSSGNNSMNRSTDHVAHYTSMTTNHARSRSTPPQPPPQPMVSNNNGNPQGTASRRGSASQRSSDNSSTHSLHTSSSAGAGSTSGGSGGPTSIFDTKHSGGFSFDAFGLDASQINKEVTEAMHDLKDMHPDLSFFVDSSVVRQQPRQQPRQWGDDSLSVASSSPATESRSSAQFHEDLDDEHDRDDEGEEDGFVHGFRVTKTISSLPVHVRPPPQSPNSADDRSSLTSGSSDRHRAGSAGTAATMGGEAGGTNSNPDSSNGGGRGMNVFKAQAGFHATKNPRRVVRPLEINGDKLVNTRSTTTMTTAATQMQPLYGKSPLTSTTTKTTFLPSAPDLDLNKSNSSRMNNKSLSPTARTPRSPSSSSHQQQPQQRQVEFFDHDESSSNPSSDAEKSDDDNDDLGDVENIDYKPLGPGIGPSAERARSEPGISAAWTSAWMESSDFRPTTATRSETGAAATTSEVGAASDVAVNSDVAVVTATSAMAALHRRRLSMEHHQQQQQQNAQNNNIPLEIAKQVKMPKNRMVAKSAAATLPTMTTTTRRTSTAYEEKKEDTTFCMDEDDDDENDDHDDAARREQDEDDDDDNFVDRHSMQGVGGTTHNQWRDGELQNKIPATRQRGGGGGNDKQWAPDKLHRKGSQALSQQVELLHRMRVEECAEQRTSFASMRERLRTSSSTVVSNKNIETNPRNVVVKPTSARSDGGDWKQRSHVSTLMQKLEQVSPREARSDTGGGGTPKNHASTVYHGIRLRKTGVTDNLANAHSTSFSTSTRDEEEQDTAVKEEKEDDWNSDPVGTRVDNSNDGQVNKHGDVNHDYLLADEMNVSQTQETGTSDALGASKLTYREMREAELRKQREEEERRFEIEPSNSQGERDIAALIKRRIAANKKTMIASLSRSENEDHDHNNEASDSRGSQGYPGTESTGSESRGRPMECRISPHRTTRQATFATAVAESRRAGLSPTKPRQASVAAQNALEDARISPVRRSDTTQGRSEQVKRQSVSPARRRALNPPPKATAAERKSVSPRRRHHSDTNHDSQSSQMHNGQRYDEEPHSPSRIALRESDRKESGPSSRNNHTISDLMRQVQQRRVPVDDDNYDANGFHVKDDGPPTPGAQRKIGSSLSKDGTTRHSIDEHQAGAPKNSTPKATMMMLNAFLVGRESIASADCAGTVKTDPSTDQNEASSIRSPGSAEQGPPAMKNDPKFEKYFKMLKLGMPMDVVKHAMTRDGLDPSLMDGDHNKPTGVPLKNDSKYSKYFKMLSIGLPMEAVKHAMERDGLDSHVMDQDHNLPVKSASERDDGPKEQDSHRRARLHWNTLRKVTSNSLWAQIDQDEELDNIEIDEEEFQELFQAEKTASAARKAASGSNGNRRGATVRVIDAKRANNGGIILARLKMSHDEMADAVDRINDSAITAEQIENMIEYLPTKEERKALEAYMLGGGQDAAEKFEGLCECEKFMVSMMTVKHAKRKVRALLFKLQFESCVKDIQQDAEIVEAACDELSNSVRLRQLLGIILTFGNRLNTAGNGKRRVGAFTLDSLLKLNQAKAFDKKTTFLEYIILIVRRNNELLLRFKDDVSTVFKADKIFWDQCVADLEEVENQLENVRKISLYQARHHGFRQRRKKHRDDEEESLSDDDVSLTLEEEVEALRATPIGLFTLSAIKYVSYLRDAVECTKAKFARLLEYFGEERKMQPHELFEIIVNFSRDFDKAKEEVFENEKKKKREERKRQASSSHNKAKTASRGQDLSRINASPSRQRTGLLKASNLQPHMGSVLSELKAKKPLVQDSGPPKERPTQLEPQRPATMAKSPGPVMRPVANAKDATEKDESSEEKKVDEPFHRSPAPTSTMTRSDNREPSLSQPPESPSHRPDGKAHDLPPESPEPAIAVVPNSPSTPRSDLRPSPLSNRSASFNSSAALRHKARIRRQRLENGRTSTGSFGPSPSQSEANSVNSTSCPASPSLSNQASSQQPATLARRTATATTTTAPTITPTRNDASIRTTSRAAMRRRMENRNNLHSIVVSAAPASSSLSMVDGSSS